MNSTALAIIQPDELETIQRTGKLLAASGYFDGKGNTPQDIAKMATKIMAGREMGFGPFASVNGIHIISGKPSVGANLMAAAVKSSERYDYRVREMSNDVCRLEFFERIDGKWESAGISEFTKEDAKSAGTQNMNKFPRNMLFARALSNGVRWYCPDVFSGNAVYVPEELGAEVDGDGNIVEASYTVTKPTERVVDTAMGEITSPEPPGSPLGTATDVDFGMGSTDDNPFDDKELLKLLDHLNMLGEDVYGAQWEQVREHNVKRVSGGKATSSDKLTPEQLQKLIAGIEKVRGQRTQPIAVAA